MAFRYCIDSGDYNDPAIWSMTDGGNGGATVPAVDDDEIYNRSVIVTGRPSSLTHNKNYSIGPNADVVFYFVDGIDFYVLPEKRLRIDGKLSVNVHVYIYSGAVLDIAEGGLFNLFVTGMSASRRNASSSTTGIIDNKGRIDSTNIVYVYANWQQEDRHYIGRVSARNVYVIGHSITSGATSTARFRGLIDANSLTLDSRQTSPIVIDFGATVVRTGTLTFQRSQADPDQLMRIVQNGSMSVSGNVNLAGVSASSPFDWTLGSNASLAFVGTNDQKVTMPSDVTGQTWRLQKCDSRGRKTGTLDLSNFVGGLCGNENEPGYAERLIVRGPSVVVTESDMEVDELHMFGVTTIPGGVTVRARHVILESGSSLSGGGTLATNRVTENGGSMTCHRKRLNNIITQIKR